jgi:hypothetical protein
LIETEKILGTETHSLSKTDAWTKAVTLTAPIDSNAQKRQHAYMLTTDGFSNSYVSHEEYIKSVEGYFSLINEHGADAVSGNLAAWLTETSELGCGDDITALFAYFDEKGRG